MQTLGRVFWLCITIILIVFAVLFATSNETATTVHLWPLEEGLTAPLWLALIAAFMAGGLLGALVVWGQAITIRARLWHLQRQFNKLQADKQKIVRSDGSLSLPNDSH